MRRLAALTALVASHAAHAGVEALIVEGLGGEPQYVRAFAEQSDAIRAALLSLPGEHDVRVLRGDDAQRERIMSEAGRLGQERSAASQTAVFLIGHGSYDGHDYKFNIPGPDLSGADIVDMLAAADTQQLIVVTGSASGALQHSLRRDGRIVVTGTRNGAERHATRFGGYFASALSDDGADTDKNGTVSVDEAFRYASRRVREFFEQDNRLATEHAELAGDAAARFALARLVDAAREPARRGADPELRALLVQRDGLNARIAELQSQRDTLGEADYRDALQSLVLELALIEEAIDERSPESADEN